MKTSNPVFDTLVETQTNFVNNWMDSARKMQAAMASGNIAHEGQSLYKEYVDKQMDILNGMQRSTANWFGEQKESQPQDFFRNWFNQQAAYAKQMADFNQSINNSYMNFGRPAHDYMSNFGQSNTAFTNIYNAWMHALNSSYDTMSRNMNSNFNKDVFTNFFQGSQVYSKMQEFFQPMIDMMQKGQFNMDAFKTMFSAEAYHNLSKNLFNGFYNEPAMKDAYDNGMKQLQDFFTKQNNLGKEYFAQLQTMSKNIPDLFNSTSASAMKDFYNQVHNVFGKTFEPLMKVVNPGKEKENAEAMIAMMDKMTDYAIKQAELQAFLQTTAKAGMERIAKQYAEKYSDPQTYTQLPSAEEMYSEWMKVNEQLFTELFASEEFSKVKGEALNLSMDVKRHFEKQFEASFGDLPVAFKSEVEDMQKTIYDLKKQVKELQNKLAMQGAAGAELSDDEKNGKARKK